MKSIGILGLALGGGLLVCGYAGAQDAPAENPKEQIQLLKQQQRECRKRLGAVKKRLNLGKDEEIVKLRKAVQEAQQAYNGAIKVKLSADPEGAELITQIDEIGAKIKELYKKPKKVKKQKKAPVE